MTVAEPYSADYEIESQAEPAKEHYEYDNQRGCLVPIPALQFAKIGMPLRHRIKFDWLGYEARGAPSERSTLGNAWSSAGALK